MAHPTVDRLLKPNYLRYNQRERLAETKAGHEEQIKNPFVKDKAPAVKAIRSITKMLNDQAPPTDLSGEEKNLLYAHARQLEQEIQPSLLPLEVMRRCPDSGTPRDNLRREMAMKPKILEWKRCQILLNPDSDDPNLANTDRIRPQLTTAGTSGFMADARIPGHLAMSAQAKRNWPLGEPKADTALKQAKRRTEQDPERAEAIRQKRIDSLAKARVAKAAQRGTSGTVSDS